MLSFEFEGAGRGHSEDCAEDCADECNGDRDTAWAGNRKQITLDYQTIEVTYTNGGKSAMDDWESPK